MKITESFYAPSRKEWRAWLKKHHKTKKEVWLIYYKKESGKPRVPYNDAVEEALCFGWIDAVRYRPEVFKQRLDYFVKMTQKNKRYGMMEKKK